MPTTSHRISQQFLWDVAQQKTYVDIGGLIIKITATCSTLDGASECESVMIGDPLADHAERLGNDGAGIEYGEKTYG